MGKKITLADIAKILKKDKTKGDTSYWGVVQSVNTTDGKVTSYNVSLGGDAGTVKCRKLAGAKVNDTVLVTLRSTGEAIVVGTKNGDTDVSDVATDLDNNYYNKTETEQKIGELGGGQAVYSATCATEASTTAKVATCSGFTLREGAIVNVSFTYANTAADPTLNVNSTGAKAIQLNGAAITSSYYWKAGKAVQFYYNGTAWQLLLSAYFSDLTALSAAIGGMSIKNGAIYSGTHSTLYSTNAGSYLGTDGICYVGSYSNNKCRVTIDNPTSLGSDIFSVAFYDSDNQSWAWPSFAITDQGDVSCGDISSDGDITCNNLSTIGALGIAGSFETVTASKTGISVTAGEQTVGSFTATKSGYMPIALGGFRLTNGNGSGASYGIVFQTYISSASDGSVTIGYGIRALGASQGGNVSNCTLNVPVTWVKI